ncbi:114_t:CDS:2 [Rhizophagus irregularis]|nr:114_t:CDS:2 [Rhizophagus irregularis]
MPVNLDKMFKGWENDLVPEDFSLLSILKFRKTKDDFSFNKKVEHTLVSKFVSYVAENADENWKEAAFILKRALSVSIFKIFIDTKRLAMETSYELPPFLNVSPLIVLKQVIIDFNLFLLFKCQTQWESTNSFWSNVELEKVEKDEQLLNRKMDQAEIQFGLDQTLAGNEAQVILNQIKLGILSDRKNSKRKATNDDTGKDDTDALTSPIEKDEIDSFFQSATKQSAIMKRLKLDEKNILNEEGELQTQGFI